MTSSLGRAFFGARAQVVIGALAFLVGLAAWLYWSLVSPPTVRAVFHVSMFYGQVAAYAIIATGLGYRAAERIEAHVVEAAERVSHADRVEHADDVS